MSSRILEESFPTGKVHRDNHLPEAITIAIEEIPDIGQWISLQTGLRGPDVTLDHALEIDTGHALEIDTGQGHVPEIGIDLIQYLKTEFGHGHAPKTDIAPGHAPKKDLAQGQKIDLETVITQDQSLKVDLFHLKTNILRYNHDQEPHRNFRKGSVQGQSLCPMRMEKQVVQNLDQGADQDQGEITRIVMKTVLILSLDQRKD